MTCCFFASLKTLLISTKAKCLTPKSTSRASFSLAGFQVTLIGRFWVTPEAEYLQEQTLLGATPDQIAALKEAYARSGMRGFWLTVLEFTEPSEQSRISPYQIASYYSILDKKDELLNG